MNPKRLPMRLFPTTALAVAAEGIIRRFRPELVAVRTDRRGDRMTEVLEGLRGGEQVVEYPADKVADGVAVRIRTK